MTAYFFHIQRWQSVHVKFFLFKYNLDTTTTYPTFGLTWVRTHDLQIMDSTVYIPEMLVLTTE